MFEIYYSGLVYPAKTWTLKYILIFFEMFGDNDFPPVLKMKYRIIAVGFNIEDVIDVKYMKAIQMR